MIIILSVIVAMVLLTIGLNIKLGYFKKLKEVAESEELNTIAQKFPSNADICKQILKKLKNEEVKIEEDNSSRTSLYLVMKNKILIGKVNAITRVQTVIHECIHSTQNKIILKFNVIFANLNNLYFLIIAILSLFNIINYATSEMCLWIFVFLQFVLYAVRSFLEIDAMTRAEYLSKEYIEKAEAVTADEKEKIIQEYIAINKIGIKLYNYTLAIKMLVRILIYAVIMVI